MSKTPKERYTEQGKKFFGCWLDENLVAKIKSEAANQKMLIPDLIALKFKENDDEEKGTEPKHDRSRKVLVKSKDNK